MTLTPGTKLGPYEILSPLGAGGMGEVYRARDTRLGRDVAVKVLPQHLSSNSEVRARFEREAKTVSSLNHPHICVLHDVGREGDTDYLVMELIEGETLAARLAKGAMPLDEVVKLGVQIADALDRAHRAGIVHRDLKPGNVMLTRSGAKLMDFGLARATGLAGPASGSGVTMAALTQSPTIATPLTAEGTLVGTFQYMSPEQLEGREADVRADIWALGCVLYEMATGRRAFEGKSQASLIGAIMNSTPAPVSQFAPMSPPAFERLVKQCLARDPDERWQSAGDVRRELEWIATSSSSSAARPLDARRRGLPRGTVGWIGGFVMTMAAMAYAFGPWRHAEPAGAPLVRFEIAPPEGTTFQMTAETAISPDGASMVFVALDSVNTGHLYVRALSSNEARLVPGTADAGLPFWSPDGRMIAYFAKGKLYKVGLDGSNPVALCDAPDARGGSWSPGGTIVFAPNNQSPIARVSANGGTPVDVTTINTERGERGHRYPQFLPDGRRFLYVGVGAEDDVVTWAASLEGGEPVEVCRGGSMGVWAPPGWLLHMDTGVNADRRRLVARRFDPKSLRTTGDPELLIDPASSNNFGYTNVAADARGTLVVQHNELPIQRLFWMDRAGRELGEAVGDVQMMGGALSPDGTRVAYAGRDPRDVFVLDLSSGISTRVTFENKLVNNLVWSPDGSRVAFSRITSQAGWNVFTRRADGTGPDSLLFRGPGMLNYPMDWSRDGRHLVVLCAERGGNFDLWIVPADGGEARLYEQTPGVETGASLSPDGRWILSSVDEGGKGALYVQSFPQPGTRFQVSFPNPRGAVWSPGGGEIFVVNEDRELWTVRVSTDGSWKQGGATRLFRAPATVNVVDFARDGNRMLASTVVNRSTMSHLDVVLNWTKLIGAGR